MKLLPALVASVVLTMTRAHVTVIFVSRSRRLFEHRPQDMQLALGHTIRLEIASRLDLIDAAQVVLAHVVMRTALDEDTAHYVSVALRESLINAIRHGNRMDECKSVQVSFCLSSKRLEIRVRDQGCGFNPHTLPDPRTEENLLRSDGRGVFFIRSFMDEVTYSFPRGGGTLVRMVKRLPVRSKMINAARS